MTRFRSVAVACGLAGLVALGGAAWTAAQPPGDGGGERPAASPRQKLRERLVTLRTEVELLQLDHDTQRAGLLELMKSAQEAEAKGPVFDPAALKGWFLSALDSAGERAVKEAVERGETLERVLEKARKDAQSQFEKGAKQGLAEAEKSFKADQARLAELIAVKKKEFAVITTAFHEKKLELDEVERRYAEAR